MLTDELLKDVNAKLRKLRDDAVASRHDPFVIGLAEQMIRLTNDEDEKEADIKAVPKCPHDVVNRRTGICMDCGQEVPSSTR